MNPNKTLSFALLGVLAVGCLAMSATAQRRATQQEAKKAVNATCPITGEPIDGQTFLAYEGKTVGFCCDGCDDRFAKWDDQRKAKYVLASFKQSAKGTAKQATSKPAAQAEPKGDLYTLGTCPISGAALGSRGDVIVKQYNGREVRFCCKGCPGRFEADKEAGFKKIDAQLVKEQMHYYPFDTCMMTDEPLMEDGEDIAVNFIYKNRLIRTCCNACVKKFKKDPAAYLKKIDAAIVKKQREHYPLENCVVGGGSLGSMGEPVEIISGNRLVRFCCAGCKPKFEMEPAKYLAMVDAGWKAQHADASHDDHAEQDHKKADRDRGKSHDDHDHDDHDGS